MRGKSEEGKEQREAMKEGEGGRGGKEEAQTIPAPQLVRAQLLGPTLS